MATATRLLRAALCSILILGAIAGVFDDPNVTMLTDATLEDTLKKHQRNLVVFYAPWCGYCQQLSPKWSEVARELAEAKSSVLVAAIDAEENQKAAEEYEIEGLPTIKWISRNEEDGKLEAKDYNGMPEAKGILRWVEKLESGTPAPELKTKEDVERSREYETSIIGVFDKFEGDAYAAFIEQALESEDVVEWFTTTDQDLVGVDGAPSLVFARNFSNTPLEVVRRPFGRAGARDSPAEEIAEFVDANKHPDFYAYDASGIATMMETLEFVEREHHVHAIVPERLLNDKEFLQRAREAGRAIRDHAQLILSVAGDDSEIKDTFKFEKLDNAVQVFVAHTESIKKYSPPRPIKPEAFDAELIQNLMESIEKGEDAFRVWASAPVPEKDTDDHGVTTAVRSTLDAIIGDKTKDVVVVSYVPEDDEEEENDFYLGVLRSLADALKDIPSIKVVKFDSYANEHKLLEYPFEELPAVTLFPANGDKKPIHLEDHSSFSVKAIAEFIHANAGVKFELPADLPDEDHMFQGIGEDDDDLGEEFSLSDLGLDDEDDETAHDEL